jgi:hypothetical protein
MRTRTEDGMVELHEDEEDGRVGFILNWVNYYCNLLSVECDKML